MTPSPTPLSPTELTLLWRTEQVLHGVARCMRDQGWTEQQLGFSYLAVCECATGVQGLAVRVQRELGA